MIVIFFFGVAFIMTGIAYKVFRRRWLRKVLGVLAFIVVVSILAAVLPGALSFLAFMMQTVNGV